MILGDPDTNPETLPDTEEFFQSQGVNTSVLHLTSLTDYPEKDCYRRAQIENVIENQKEHYVVVYYLSETSNCPQDVILQSENLLVVERRTPETRVLDLIKTKWPHLIVTGG